ncbi:MAG: SAM-dependent methyltransferase [Hyphomicrobiales bacterium]|nr:MAG: SAM-dependent methyltransferase [Hyphomicrobiales bacterium]
MADLHYDHPRLAKLYDLDSGWSEDRDFYLNLAGDAPQEILDLGCGTGLICNQYTKNGHQVIGLDPSAGMLDIARKSHFGKQIKWVKSFSQDFNLNQTFDLIIMTGHAFQVLLTDEDVLNVFRRVKTHLKSNGIFTFESRNPQIDWVSRWNHSYELNLEGETIKVTRRVISHQDELMVFEHEYIFEDETLVSKSHLRFMPKQKIAKLYSQANLALKTFIGDWTGGAFDPTTSQEMIFKLTMH